MKDPYQIIKKPLFTEKGTRLKEGDNQFLIEVKMDANKIEIKEAFEMIFHKKVDKVCTMIKPAKHKRLGKSIGMTQRKKKALVTLKKGETLDFVEGV